MQTILFDSADLPGDERLRRERWVDSLSSGYVRLRADAKPDVRFNGRLKIMQLGQAAIGRISGTVQTISRTANEIAAENTDNAVLLLNSGKYDILIEQKRASIACAAGAAVIIEQCEPSSIKVSAQHVCDFMAVQMPRQLLRERACGVQDRFMMPIAASTSALALTRAYVDTLLDRSGATNTSIPRFAADHITDLIAAAVAPENLFQETQAPNLRAARFETIRRELDRNFMIPGFSLTVLARRLGVTPRYAQVLFAEAATSFSDELTRRRLTRAHDMLMSPRYDHMNVMAVAHECGFSTVSHFHRMFRRHFETTPGELRSRGRQVTMTDVRP
jgi:AraC-like DNA-binding protein